MRRPRLRIVAILILFVSAIVAASYAVERRRLGRESNRIHVVESPFPPRFDDRRVFLARGIVPPPPLFASNSGIADDEEVIGIIVEGRARAYRLVEMEDPTRHVVNDVVGETPITVTYCDITRCVRAFSGSRGRGPLDVSQAGLKGGKMVIRIGGVDYLQETAAPLNSGSKPLPFSSFPANRTTWNRWRDAHPDSEVVSIRGR